MVEYNPIHDTEVLVLKETPLQFTVQNSCSPSSFTINDDADEEKTLSSGTQTGNQGETDLTWGDSDFVTEGVDFECCGCPDNFKGVQLLTAIDANGIGLDAAFDLQGGPTDFQFVDDEIN